MYLVLLKTLSTINFLALWVAQLWKLWNVISQVGNMMSISGGSLNFASNLWTWRKLRNLYNIDLYLALKKIRKYWDQLFRLLSWHSPLTKVFCSYSHVIPINCKMNINIVLPMLLCSFTEKWKYMNFINNIFCEACGAILLWKLYIS